MKLLLFDIDGTLLHGKGLGKRALLESIEAVLERHDLSGAFAENGPVSAGPPGAQNGIAGKTDLQFLHEGLAAGLDAAAIERVAPEIFVEHAARLRQYFTVEAGATLLPGVDKLLDAVQDRYRMKRDCVPAVLTGNIQVGAQIKLGIFDLNRYFVTGAFGNEGRVRRELPPIALRRARQITGVKIRGEDIVIIGDTPNDIDCGRPLGARTIAVTTGPYSREELAEHNPDHIFDGLADTEAVLRALLD